MKPLPHHLEKKRDELADSEMEKQFYENQSGFLEKPYKNYRWHNGFTAGFNACFETLCNLAPEFDRQATMKDDNPLVRSMGKQYQFGFTDGARWQFEKDRASLAAKDAELKACIKTHDLNIQLMREFQKLMKQAESEITSRDEKLAAAQELIAHTARRLSVMHNQDEIAEIIAELKARLK